MNTFSPRQRYFLYPLAISMAYSFDGLSGLVVNQMGGDLMSGDVFIFINRRQDRIKLLVWDQSGFVIWYKRLEKGTFELPYSLLKSKQLELKWEELILLLGGVELSSVKRRKRYSV